QAVGMAVIAAFELDDAGAPRIAARKADRRHGGFCARADEAYLIHGGDALDDRFGDLDLRFGGGAERQPVLCGFLYGFDDLGVGVSEDGGAPGADVVDVARAFGVPDVGAL